MPEYTWDMKGYASKYGFYTSENLSRREAERTLQLEPEPPKESDLNNYIIQAQQQNSSLKPAVMMIRSTPFYILMWIRSVRNLIATIVPPKH